MKGEVNMIAYGSEFRRVLKNERPHPLDITGQDQK
jgi:hypothetical protein